MSARVVARAGFPNALIGKVKVDQVYSNDPAQFGPGSLDFVTLDHNWSTVGPL